MIRNIGSSATRALRLVIVGGAALALVSLASPASAASAQHTPAPAKASGAKASLAGTWALDPYVSDHPEQVARALRSVSGEGPGEARGENRRGERGEPSRDDTGRGDVESGEGGSARPRMKPISDADRKLLAELTDPVRFPPLTLKISQTDAAVTIATGIGVPDVLHPDGKSEKRTLTAGTVTRTAAWNQDELAVAYTVGDAGTLTYTYGIAPTTGQLVVRVDFERPVAEGAAFEVKLVYDPAS